MTERKPSLETVLKKLQGYAEHHNIAEELDDEELARIGMEGKREYDIDVESRADWQASAERAMDIALQVRKPKNYPFEGASNIKYPLVTVAALQFGARAYPAIVDGNRIVKGAPIGKDEDGQKRAKAERIGQHMSWQLLYEMEEWEEDTDVLLHHLPIVGCAFRKVWRSDELGRNKAEMVPAIHLVVNNKARNLDEAPRVTHEIPMYPQEIKERQLNETFLDVELGLPAEGGGDVDAPHWLLEQHRYIDLDGDGYREPYIVTLHRDHCKVLRIVANYEFDEIVHDGKRITRIPKDRYFVKYSFLPDPKGGFYDVGFGKLLESLSETIDTMINQMIDAGHLQIAGGGFIGSGVRLKKGEVKLSPGKYINVEAPGSVLKDAIVNMEHPGPTAVHMSLLELMLTAATDITAVKDILTGETGDKGVQTATTTLAMIEQGLKVFTAIYKRVYRALKQEFKLLFYLNAKYMDDQQYFTVLDEQQAVAKADYDWKSIDVVPVADPRTVTDMQKMARAQFLREFLGTGLVNDQVVLLRVFDAVGIEKPEELLPQGPSPMDELTAADAASKVDKTVAETEKIKTETAMMPIEAQVQVELEDRQQQQSEQEAAAQQELAARQQEQAELEAAAGIVQGEEQLRQSGAGMEADIALQEAGLEQQERALEQKAQAERAKVA